MRVPIIPGAVLVPFETYRLALPEIALRNPAFDLGDDSQVLDRFGYAIPSLQDAPDRFLAKRRTFYAERYGGEGMLRHGGGVRCGLDGDYQIKGIGRNPLAGADVAVAESNGCVHLRDAIGEAILGELCHHALPYGGSRIAAVISTGAHVCHGEKRVRTGLAVRESVLRPGHFVRSVYFQPNPELKGKLSSDAKRVRDSIQFLPESLPRPESISVEEWSRMEDIERLHFGLAEMAFRFADQTAAAESKRIMHGAISASNVGVDGRWLDYDTLSVLPGYGNVQSLPSYYWDTPKDFQQILRNLGFYVSKYYPVDDKSKLPQEETLGAIFASHHREASHRRFLLLAGFPLELLEPHWHRPEAKLLSEKIIGLACSGHRKVYELFPDEDDAFGDFKLGRILAVLAAFHHLGDCEIRLTLLVPDVDLRGDLLSAYRAFAGLVYAEASSQGISPIALRRLSVLNATKAAKCIPLFLKKRLVKELVSLDEGNEGIEKFRYQAEMLFSQLADQASFVYQDPKGFCSCLWRCGETSIDFDAKQNEWHLNESGKGSFLPWEAMESAYRECFPMSEMRCYWGEELWSALA